MYRCEARTIEGFVQQLAVSYLAHGYCFYVVGQIPAEKDPRKVDRKLIERYQIGVSKWARARRKRMGLGNVQYLRYGHFFVLLATHGHHKLMDEERDLRDFRRQPLAFHGYSISYRRGVDRSWHPSVRIRTERYLELKSHFLELATHRSAKSLAREFQRVPFEPYAPVRRQLLNILRAVNRARRHAGFEPVPVTALRLKRRPVVVFDLPGQVRGGESPERGPPVAAIPPADGGSEELPEALDPEREAVVQVPVELDPVGGVNVD